MSATGLLRIFLLGAFRIERDARPIRLPTRKIESLLAYLVLHPEALAREKLAALFWSDSSDLHARHSLRTALNVIRKQLGDKIFLGDYAIVQVNPGFPIWVDAREFAEIGDWRLDRESPISNL
jgi:DNA-binding SARP family transcriptional activator